MCGCRCGASALLCSRLLSPTAPTHMSHAQNVWPPLPSIDGFAACGASGSKHQSGLPNQQEHAEASIIALVAIISGSTNRGDMFSSHVVRGLFSSRREPCGRQVQVFVVLACFLGWCRLTYMYAFYGCLSLRLV